MARKKQNKKTSKEFNVNPFKTLKGLVVSGQSSSGKTAKEVPVTVPEDQIDDEELFEREMKMLRVEKRDAGTAQRPLPRETDPEETAPEKDAAPTTDQELFLAALGNMDSVFRDELPVQEEPLAAPRRMRQLRQGKLVPEAQLDLHGATREDARQKVRYFLEDGVYQGYKTVLIITGRGKGSQQGPVLRDDMEKYLSREARAWVAEWGRAPARYGGEGALVVFLRSSRKN
ncbi:Smr domain protein [Syntrophotalea carbinolica DSM 2380]|uniref:Smr domain protein n=1 Tax=Syntrophotalea carbinolica (strain DSM 2380 / NBRC 103641 / GraBd1) TaxID=338963 RepID=Q3A2X6_SYNC1|nr:Smr/MutS family protein [Syntrophotalea carbinolica]ABA89281.1 Smr domain protein [Syntrophotalea carbinolica DSM 2380]